MKLFLSSDWKIRYLSYQQDKYYKIWTFLKKLHIIFQQFSKNVINDLYKLCKSSYKKEQLKLHQSLLGVKGGGGQKQPSAWTIIEQPSLQHL